MRTLDFGHFFKIHSSGKFAHWGSAFFLKILYGRVTRTASCPFLSCSKPRLVPWAPLPLSHIFWVQKKLQTKKLMMYCPGGPFIMVTPVVTSWAVTGQRMVFLHMYLQTRVTLKAFPVATPRGRSVSFPTRGTMVTYVTWDVFWQYVEYRIHFINRL